MLGKLLRKEQGVQLHAREGWTQRRSSEVMDILEGELVSGPHSSSHDYVPS